MNLKLLAHNLIAHPIAGLFWALGSKLEVAELLALGDSVHECWAPTPEHCQQRYDAEFNLVFFGRGAWSASDARAMSDEQLAATLEILHNVMKTLGDHRWKLQVTS